MQRYSLSAWLCGAAALILTGGPAAAQAAPKVVASIKPVHSLVAGVMAGVGEPTLLVKGAGSPHSYNLKPSEARALAQADLVFWVGEGLETFLTKPLDSLAGGSTVITLATVDGIELLATREGGAWEGHGEHDDHADHGEHAEHGDHADHGEHDDHADHDDHGEHDDHADHGDHADHDDHAEHGEHHDHAHGEHDMHIWLDPHNTQAMVRAIVSALSAVDSENATRYEANGARLATDLTALDSEIAAALASVKAQPYIVFHDAYAYFETHYGTNAVGAITVSPERTPGAKRLAELRDKIADLGAVCVFSEPQFEPALVTTIIDGTTAKTGELDPLGAALTPGPQAYFDLIRNIATSMVGCLSPDS